MLNFLSFTRLGERSAGYYLVERINIHQDPPKRGAIMNRKMTATAALVAGLALTLTPAVAMAATPTDAVTSATTTTVGAISKPTATLVNHAPYGMVYQLKGTVSGTHAGDTVRVLNANNQPAAGFTPFKIGSPITSYTVYYNPGSLAGQYKVQIGNQISAGVALNVIPAVAARADGGR
ncbi:MAG TPA: hypothetical protein DCQ04_16970 [Actinobacteria bacterium]|jgi:hypothetical protein|nr:hypothetical protein [Actinomycetota bacterium]